MDKNIYVSIDIEADGPIPGMGAAAFKPNSTTPEATKRNMPKKWFHGCPPHTHKALDDAIGQGILFLNILAET